MLNDPRTDPEGNVFGIKIEMRKDNTLLELKQRVGDILKVEPSEFVVKRYRIQREFKNMGSKLSELGLTSGNLLMVEFG